MNATIADRVIAIVAEHAGLSAFSIDAYCPLDDRPRGLGLDSLDEIELIMSLEAAFEILIDEQEVGPDACVGTLIAIVEGLKGAQS